MLEMYQQMIQCVYIYQTIKADNYMMVHKKEEKENKAGGGEWIGQTTFHYIQGETFPASMVVPRHTAPTGTTQSITR